MECLSLINVVCFMQRTGRCIFFSHQTKMFFRSLKMLASALAAAYFFFRARSLMGGAGRLAPGMAPPRPMDPAHPPPPPESQQ